MSQHQQLRDKTVVITGASSGLGRAAALAFAEAGAHVVLAARRQEALDDVRAKPVMVKDVAKIGTNLAVETGRFQVLQPRTDLGHGAEHPLEADQVAA